MQHHTGEHVFRLTARQRLILAAVIVGILLGPAGMLFAALHAHGPAPTAPPAPTPVSVVAA